jgi:enamine deaminase RidA (YjgF/YER057c/UK114 family)
MNVEQRLEELGIELWPPGDPVANYVGAVRVGNLLFVSGHLPRPTAGKPQPFRGKLGEDFTVAEGYQAAREVGLNILATIKAVVGDLDRVKRFIKVLGMVNATPDFADHPQVINGFSDLMADVFGEKGRHARSAVGMGSLPFQIPVEIEAIVELEP